MTYFEHCASIAEEKQLSFDLQPLSLSLSLSLSFSEERPTERATNHNLNSEFPKMAADILAQRFAGGNGEKSCGSRRIATGNHFLASAACLLGTLDLADPICGARPSPSPIMSHPSSVLLTLFDRGNYGTSSHPLRARERDRSLPFALSSFFLSSLPHSSHIR